MRTTPSILVREANPDDCPVIVSFNSLLALETEGKMLCEETLTAGVQAALADASKARYLMAEIDGNVAGQLMHTWEWSDWRNGHIWWLQSVYVIPGQRRQGIFRRLFEAILAQAEAAPDVVGVRLYVENENHVAQSTYEGLGMCAAGYHVMEKLFPKGA